MFAQWCIGYLLITLIKYLRQRLGGMVSLAHCLTAEGDTGLCVVGLTPVFSGGV